MALNTGLAGFGGEEIDVDNRQGQSKLKQQINHQLKLRKYLFKDKLWLPKNSGILENELRKVVRPIVEHAIEHLVISRPIPSDPSRKYKLEFIDTLPSEVFTENNLVAAARVRLLDAVSNQPITDGPLSSKKVEIEVVHGHFKAEQLDDWTKFEYCKNTVTKRDNKKPLLVGQRVITLCNGVGLIHGVRFTDNSSWVPSKMFRLGAKLVSDQDQVREAVTTPVRVKDQRGESYQKHKIPSPEDEVWRLPYIFKNGKICKELEEENIRNVKDFVAQYHKDQSLLRRILKNIPPKKWDEIIQIAMSCCSRNFCTNLSDANLAQCNIIPNDQQGNHMLEPLLGAGEDICTHELQQSTAPNNSMLEQILAGSSSVDEFLPPPSTTMFNVETPSYWLSHDDQLIGEGMFNLISCANDVNTSITMNQQPTGSRNVG